MPQEFKFQCTCCGQSISTDEDLSGTTQKCPTCTEIFAVPNLSEQSADDDAPPDFLDWVENVLLRMVRGIFRFIFGVLPPKLWRFVCDTFPWLAKMIRIAALSAIWCLLVAWPFLVASAIPKKWPEFTSLHQPFIFIQSHQSASALIAYTWAGLALLGSLWGIFHITIRRRRQQKQQAGQSVSEPSIT